MLREHVAHFTSDGKWGRVMAYVVEVDEHGEYSWCADADFGPTDTALDACRWLTKVLSGCKVFPLS